MGQTTEHQHQQNLHEQMSEYQDYQISHIQTRQTKYFDS